MPSKIEQIVAVAARIEPQPFTIEEAAVEAWRIDKLAFGLDGFEELYPDHHAVLCMFSGAHGIVRRGWVDRVATGKYQITDLGREEAERIASGTSREEAAKVSMSHSGKLDHLLATTAWKRYRSGKIELLTVADAMTFVTITNNGILQDLATLTCRKPATLANGQVVDRQLVVEIRECDATIRRNFERFLVVKT